MTMTFLNPGCPIERAALEEQDHPVAFAPGRRGETMQSRYGQDGATDGFSR